MASDQAPASRNGDLDTAPMPCQHATSSSLNTLPTEVLLQILFHSHEPALINVSRRLRQALPPYVRYAKALAAIATCPEGPCGGLMSLVFERVMKRYRDDCWVLPLTTDRIWQLRAAVWTSKWFGSYQFEAIILELYHSFLEETLRHVKPRLPGELIRLRDHALRCRALDMISGEEFVADIKFRARRPRTRKKTYRGDLLVTFNQICFSPPGQEHRLQFWGIRHLYDLPDGLFNIPMTAHQIRLIRFLTTLDWHWQSRSVLAPKRNDAFAAALEWAIREQYVHAIATLLELYQKYCAAGNEKVLNVKQHLEQCLQTQDRAVLNFVGRGFGVPASVLDFFRDMTALGGQQQTDPLHVSVR